MVVEDLVEEVAAVVGGELGVPDEAVDVPHADGLHRVLAVVHAVLLLEVDGVAGQLLAEQKNDLLPVQQLADIQHLEIGAEGLPAVIVEINVVLTANVLAGADVVI